MCDCKFRGNKLATKPKKKVEKHTFDAPELFVVRSPDRRSQNRTTPSICPVATLIESDATATQVDVELCRKVVVCRYVVRLMSHTFNDRSADPVITFGLSPPKRRTQVILF